jgi:uncharacterized caspase-like protein
MLSIISLLSMKSFLTLFTLTFIISVCRVAAQTTIQGYSKPSHFDIQKSEKKNNEVVATTTGSYEYANEKKVALVIGNGIYKNGPLKNAVNDALDIAAALDAKKFEVILVQNGTRNDMRNAIREFATKINDGGIGLFYYSGHGLQVDGTNYLVPIDANIEQKAEVEDECVSAASVLRVMEFSKNRINIIILDACRNNPFRSFSRSDEKGITRMDPPKGAKQGSIIAFATAPGDVASDGDGRNGLYTSKLLKYINAPGLNIEEIFKKVRIEVSNESAQHQIPWENNSLTGEFIFSTN